jgi:hypothetical protein
MTLRLLTEESTVDATRRRARDPQIYRTHARVEGGISSIGRAARRTRPDGRPEPATAC